MIVESGPVRVADGPQPVGRRPGAPTAGFAGHHRVVEFLGRRDGVHRAIEVGRDRRIGEVLPSVGGLAPASGRLVHRGEPGGRHLVEELGVPLAQVATRRTDAAIDAFDDREQRPEQPVAVGEDPWPRLGVRGCRS